MSGFASLFDLSLPPDLKNPDQYSVVISESQLGLPDRDYYLKDDPKLREIREKYVVYIEKMLAQGYRGSRYSFGYPACPRLEDQVPLLKLLGADRIGVTISDEWQLHPEQSTSAIVVLNPRANYFSV